MNSANLLSNSLQWLEIMWFSILNNSEITDLPNLYGGVVLVDTPSPVPWLWCSYFLPVHIRIQLDGKACLPAVLYTSQWRSSIIKIFYYKFFYSSAFLRNCFLCWDHGWRLCLWLLGVVYFDQRLGAALVEISIFPFLTFFLNCFQLFSYKTIQNNS